jgi:hypothetical protein
MGQNMDNPNSSAGGPFQFIDSTARQYGVQDRYDWNQSTDGASRLAQDNANTLRRTLGRDPTAAELYLAHQQGGGGASKLLANPNARAVDIVGADAVRLNGGNENMTAMDFAGKWLNKFGGGAAPSGGGMSPQGQPVPVTGGGSGVMDALMAAASDPWAMKQAGPVIQALLGQQMGRDQSQFDAQLAQADPYRQAQLEQIRMENERMRNPAAADPINVGGVLLDPNTYEPIFDSRQGQGQDAFTLSDGQIRYDADGNVIAGTPKSDAPDPTETFDNASDLRKEWNGNASVKAFATQSPAFGRLLAAAAEPSAAGDLALIFNYMKILDPGSTVREGEFATAQNAGGVGSRILARYNSLVNGERLTPEQRTDFVDRGSRLYKNAEAQYQGLYDQFAGIANRNNLPLDDALIDYRYIPQAQEGGPPPPADPPADPLGPDADGWIERNGVRIREKR